MPYYQSNTVKYTLCSSSSPLGKGGGEILERICSKLGGSLDKAIVPIDSSVVPIEGPYATRAGELQDMVLQNIDCTNLSAEYSLIDSHFSIIDDLKTVNNQETDLYFYHSDHLGSSSFITDADGIVSQHLQYLPYGELFAEQRDNTARYYTPYKFSGKEKDEETGYSYFGARYYMPELSIWSAVDPLADKYPGMSAYMYCAGNPVILKDPDGREIWITGEDGAKIKYTQGMEYKGTDQTILKQVNSLNDMNSTKNGNTVLKELTSSKNIFNLTNGKSKEGTAKFVGNEKGGGTLNMNGNNNLSEISHELFHAYQHENGQGGTSIFNEVEAYLFSAGVQTEYGVINNKASSWGSFAVGRTNSKEGKSYSESIGKLITGLNFSKKDFINAMRLFKSQSGANQSGLYNNYPLQRNNQTKILISKFYPLF